MASLVRIQHGPVIAEPLDGCQSVLVYADRARVELSGRCGVCDTQLWQQLEPVVYSASEDDRRRVIVGKRPVTCGGCNFPVCWTVDRRLIRRLKRHWTRVVPGTYR
jgi:hypothetical protein